MKHITLTRFNKIESDAQEIAMKQRGRRNQAKLKSAMVIQMAKDFARECKKIPNEYRIVYTYTGNLGTMKWSDTYQSYIWNTITKDSIVRETEKSVIVVNGAFKHIISKESIICYVW